MIDLKDIVNMKDNVEIFKQYDPNKDGSLARSYILDMMKKNRELTVYVINNIFPEYNHLIKTIDTFG